MCKILNAKILITCVCYLASGWRLEYFNQLCIGQIKSSFGHFVFYMVSDQPFVKMFTDILNFILDKNSNNKFLYTFLKANEWVELILCNFRKHIINIFLKKQYLIPFISFSKPIPIFK